MATGNPILILKNGNPFANPSNGETGIIAKSNGDLKKVDSQGTETDIGGAGGGVADGVTIDGEGTEAEPFSSLGPRAWTRIAVGVNAQDVDIVVDGETACCLEFLIVAINNNASPSAYTLQPNQVATDQVYQDIEGADGGSPETSVFADTVANIGFGAASGGYCLMSFKVLLKAGTVRFAMGSWTQMDAVPVITLTASSTAVWTDTTTEITNLRLHSNRADGWKIGSVVLYRSIPLSP